MECTDPDESKRSAALKARMEERGDGVDDSPADTDDDVSAAINQYLSTCDRSRRGSAEPWTAERRGSRNTCRARQQIVRGCSLRDQSSARRSLCTSLQYFLLRQPGRVLTQAVVDASPPQVRAKLPPMSKVLALQKRGRAVPQVSGGAGPSGAGPSGAGPSS